MHEPELGRNCELVIHRKIFQNLTAFNESEISESEEQLIQNIAILAHIFEAVIKSWQSIITEFSISDEQPSLDFYSDDFLGHDVCSRLAYYYRLLSETSHAFPDPDWQMYGEYIHGQVFNLLVEYMQLQVTYHGLGDITKRTCGALATLITFCPELKSELHNVDVSQSAASLGWDWREELWQVLNDLEDRQLNN